MAAGSPRSSKPSPWRQASTPRAGAETSASRHATPNLRCTNTCGWSAEPAAQRLGTSFFNVATQVDGNITALESHGGRSLHEQSHGESFLALLNNRFCPNGLYILDEPEAALSPQRQLSLLTVIGNLVKRGASQFIISTHSPLVLAYPDARIYHLGTDGLAPVAYEDTEQFALTRDFLVNRERYLRRLLGEST